MGTSAACGEASGSMRTDHSRERYFQWLVPQCRDEHGNPNDSYDTLFNLMFDREFEILMAMDANRAVDGCDLRVEFARSHRFSTDIKEEFGPCTFLEMVIGLSRRLSFSAGGGAPGWAWQLLSNLELHKMSDPLSKYRQRKALTIMDVVISRSYLPDGVGGFFPLAYPDEDQTRLELWYQMHAYIEELHPEH